MPDLELILPAAQRLLAAEGNAQKAAAWEFWEKIASTPIGSGLWTPKTRSGAIVATFAWQRRGRETVVESVYLVDLVAVAKRIVEEAGK
jgi:hypothetical protein